MKSNYRALWFALVALFVFAGYAEAGVWGSVKSFFTGEIWGFVLTAFAAALTFGLGKLYSMSNVKYDLVAKTFKEGAKFFEVLGTAAGDHKVSKEELAALISQGKQVFSLYEKTPEQFKSEK